MRRRLRNAVVVLTTIGALIVACPVPAGATTPPPGEAELWLFCKVNEHRRNAGLPPLGLDASLRGSARGWSSYMARHGDFRHDPGNGWVTSSGTSGENVAYVVGWQHWRSIDGNLMSSAGHRANRLGRSWGRMGVGIEYAGNGRVYYTERFLEGRAEGTQPDCGKVMRRIPPPHGFHDVAPRSYYDWPVGWLAARDVTHGVRHDRYGVGQAVTRGQMAAFLHRLARSPRTTGSRFPDVPQGAFYDVPSRWLRSTGLTTGHGGSPYFRPEVVMTRAQMVTFLWRYAGEPAPRGGMRFTDVPASAYFYDAVRWAHQHGVTNGVGNSNRFDPHGVVTREQMAAFLHRFATTPRARSSRSQPVIG